jgi:Tol biopolymer transport system component
VAMVHHLSLCCSAFALLMVACAQDPVPTASVPAVPEPQTPASTVLLHEEGVENAYPRLSNDGTRILYQSNRTGTWQLYIMDVATKQQTRITADTFNNNFVDWSADNEWIAFVSDRDGNEEIYRMKVDGSGLERLTDDPARDIHPNFSLDGNCILFNSTRGNGSLDVYRLTLMDRELERITTSGMEETCARYSPDMAHIVFLQNDEQSDDIVLMDVRDGSVKNISGTPAITDGWPMFSADGKWIWYSTMVTGRHSIHRMRLDGSGDETITNAKAGEEDGRAFISSDGHTLIYNNRKGNAIDILSLNVK